MNIATLALGTVSPGPVGTGGPPPWGIVLGPLLTAFELVVPVMCAFYVTFWAYRTSTEHKRNTALAQTESRTMKSAALPIVFMGFLFTTFLALTRAALSLSDVNAPTGHLTRNVSDGWLLFLTVLPLATAVVIAAASSITAAVAGRAERSADRDRLESVGDSV